VQDALAKINSDLQRPLNRRTFQLNQMKDNPSKPQRLGVLLWLSKIAYRKHHVTDDYVCRPFAGFLCLA
jgi:hypothetical protein